MALPEATQDFTFGGGLSEHEDAWLQTSGFTELENCEQDKAGTLRKVHGYAALATTSTNAMGEYVTGGTGTSQLTVEIGDNPRLIARGNQVGIVANGYLHSLNDSWVLQGRVSPWVAEQRTVIDAAGRKASSTTVLNDMVRHDACRSGDWAFTAFNFWGWGDGAGFFGVEDPLDAGRICVACTYLPTGVTQYTMVTESQSYGLSAPRIVAWDDTGVALLVYRREEVPATDWGHLCYRRVTPGEIGAEVDLGVDMDVFDVATDTAAARAWFAYHPADSVSTTSQDVTVTRYTIGPTALASTGDTHTEDSTGLPRTVAVSGNHTANRVCVAFAIDWDAGGGITFRDRVRAFCRTSTVASGQVWAQQNLWTSNTYFSGADEDRYRICQLAVIDLGGSNGNYLLWFDPNGELATYGGEYTSPAPTTHGQAILPSGATLVHTQKVGRVRMRTRPFFDGTRVVFLGEHSSAADSADYDTNSYYVLLAAEPFEGTLSSPSPPPPQGRFNPVGYFAQGFAPSQGWSSGTGGEDMYWTLSTPYQDNDGAWHVQSIEKDPGTLRVRIRAYKLIADDRVAQPVEFGGQTYLVGALMTAWDGLRALEAGWLSKPVIENHTAAPGTLSPGTRHYVVTYARVNAAGELLRSAPSEVVTVATAGSNLDVTLRISPYCLSNMVQSDTVEMRREIWRTVAGQASPFYLLRRDLMNPDSREAAFITDNVSDASLTFVTTQTLPFEEVPGAELPNDPPISPLAACVWKNRLCMTDGAQIAYSKEGVQSRAAEFSLNQTIPRATQTPLTAIAPLGESLMAFTEDSTAFVYGDFPAANGQGSSLVGPVEVNTDVGCTQPAGVCVVPDGLFVPTRGGLQLLTKGREYKDVGLGIERLLGEYPRVRAAHWLRGTDHVWVALAGLERGDDSSVFAVFDALHGTWSVRFRAQAATSVISVADTHYWSGVDGSVFQYAPDTWRIGVTEYTQTVTTPWLKPAGPLAEIRFKRGWLLAQKPGDSTSGLTIQVGYDFDEDYTAVATFTGENLDALEGAADGTLVVRIPAPRQRCTAFRLRFLETLPGSEPAGQADSEGLRFVAARVRTALRGAKGPLKAPRNGGA